jgi:hypothetical protein
MILLLFAIAVAILFLVANRAAYRSYFTADDFDSIASARQNDISDYGRILLKPSLGGDSIFLPAAHSITS